MPDLHTLSAVADTTFTSDTDRWQAVAANDAAADGAFVYAVRTTGIYCRPSCPSRTPRRKNVTFFDTPTAAEDDGYRPCMRCTPDARSPQAAQAEQIADTCRYIEACIHGGDRIPTLQELADRITLSPSHFHRVFTAHVGITPKAYGDAVRTQRVRNTLADSSTVTQAIFDAGFESSSRFYEGPRERLGMTPTAYKNGAPNMTIRYTIIASDLGWLVLAATERGLCTVEFGSSPEALTDLLRDRFHRATLTHDDDALAAWAEAVVDYIAVPHRDLDLPLDVQGTSFQEQVWAALRDIPLGERASYGTIAEKLGNPTASRAVAQACASNQLAVVIPCHRVVRADGGLSGYRWGTERKQALLDRETPPSS